MYKVFAVIYSVRSLPASYPSPHSCAYIPLHSADVTSVLTPLNVARSCKLHPEGGLGAEGIKMFNRNKLMIRFDTYRFDCDTKTIIVFSPAVVAPS